MGLFSRSEIKLFTSEGIKRLYQFFLLNFCILLFQILILIILILGSSSASLSGFLFSIISSFFFVSLIWVVEILIIIWLFWAFTDLALGRKEFDKQHEIFVFIASAFLIPSIFLYLIQLVLSKGMVVSSAAFYFNPTGNLATLLPQGQLLLAISIIIPVLMGLALFLFVYRLTSNSEKVPLMFACGLLITSPFTMYITSLVAYFLFFVTYRSVYNKLLRSDFKPIEKAPCPFCNKDIPTSSMECPYCKQKFQKSREAELDPVLKVDLLQQQSKLPKGYAPVKGPSEEQKKRLYMFIGAIIAIIIIVAVVALLLR